MAIPYHFYMQMSIIYYNLKLQIYYNLKLQNFFNKVDITNII